MRSWIVFALLVSGLSAWASTDCEKDLNARFKGTALADVWDQTQQLEQRIQGYIKTMEKLTGNPRQEFWLADLQVKAKQAGELIEELKAADPLMTSSRKFKIKLTGLTEALTDSLDQIGTIESAPAEAKPVAPPPPRAFRADDSVRMQNPWSSSPGFMKP